VRRRGQAEESGPRHPGVDQRWVRVRRPLVVVGGELTLEFLDLIHSPSIEGVGGRVGAEGRPGPALRTAERWHSPRCRGARHLSGRAAGNAGNATY
jgi:hypothetical protein